MIGCAGLLGLAACSGGTEEGTESSEPTLLSEEGMASLWAMQACDEAIRAPFEEDGGWAELIMKRQVSKGVEQLGSSGGLAAAHAHADAAAMYRQAALLVAYSFIETYGKTGQPTDPAGTAHLLTVSYALTGDLDSARKHAEAAGDLVELQPWHQPWATWLSEGAEWPPDLKSLPMQLPPPTVGGWPSIGTLPHYKLSEQEGSEFSVEYADPGGLVSLAMWHERTAMQAAGEHSGAVEVYGAAYRLPVEPVVAHADLPMELLFGSDYLVAGDASFIADVVAGGPEAVEAHQETSILAGIAAEARTDGKVDREKAIDLAAKLRSDLIAAMAAAEGGEKVYHRTFADLGQLGVLRGLALVAEAEGDRETSGVLRINAMERSVDAGGAPAFLLSLAAWDAANRYPARGAEIVHNLVRRYPSIAAARYGLDVLALRVSRERVDQGVGM